MEEIRSFLNGVNKDSNPLQQPKDTYRHARNFVQISEEGNIYAITNEEGTVQQNTTFPTGFKAIGSCVLDTDIIVVLADSNNNSQIGIIDANGVYERKVPEPSDPLGDANDELELRQSLPVDIIARKRLAGDRVVYFCDGPQGREMGRLNLDNPPPTGDIFDNSKVIPNQELTDIDLVEIQEVSGNLRCGMYHFVTRYYTDDLTPTSIGIPSAGIPIVDDSSSAGRDQYDGEYPDFGAVNKAISLRISNIDTSFPFMALICIRYENITNTLTIEEQPILNITGETMFTTYSGDEQDVTPLTQEELNQIPISYNTAKAVTQKDNICFWSNLTDNSNEFDQELQELFNDVTIEYVVKEVDYAPSGQVSAAGGFSIDSLPYIFENPDNNLIEYIVLEFTEEVSYAASSDPADYTFYDRGENASATITITNPGDFSDGANFDTIEVQGVTFVAVDGAPALDEEFDVSSDDLLTILANLTEAINNHPTLDGIIGAGNDGVDTIYLVAETAGIAGNSYTLTYTDNTGTAAVTTVAWAGGVAPVVYTPQAVLQDPTGSDASKLFLYFPDSMFGGTGDGIPFGGTLDVSNVLSFSGATYSDTGLQVTTTSTSSNAEGAVSLGEFTDYKNPAFTFYFKGYRRQEVYSFGAFVNFKDGAPSPNYHIPGNDKLTLSTTEATRDGSFPNYHGETFGNLGTYVSQTDYPTNQRYPGPDTGDDTLCYDINSAGGVTPANRLIRHHKMPTLELEPHWRVDPSTGQTKIRILGVRFTFNTAMSAPLREKIQSITFTRERRNQAQNRSIWAQGVVTRYINLFRDFPYKWDYDPQEDASNAAWRKIPFFNNTYINNVTVSEGNSTSVVKIAQGGSAPSITYEVGDDIAVDQPNEGLPNAGASNTRMAFFSPDTQLGVFNPSFAEGTKLTPQMAMTGGLIDTGPNNYPFKPSKNAEGGFGTVVAAQNNTVRLHTYIQAWLIVDYFNWTPPVNGGSTNPAANPTIVEARYIPKGSEVQVASLDDVIDNRYSSRHLYIETQTPPTFGIVNGSPQQLIFRAEMNPGTNWFFDDGSFNNNDALILGQVRNHLFSMIAENFNQYGTVSGATYIPIKTTRNLPNFAGMQPEPEVYGGDTFVSKFSYRNNDVIGYKGLLNSTSGNFLVGVDTGGGYSSLDAEQHDDSAFGGMNLKAIGYFFVESGVNCEYRHQYIDRSNPTNDVPEVPYFPKVGAYLALQQQAQEGDSRGYNLQYSFENDARTFSNKLAAQVQVGIFENRTIYSQEALEDEVLDSYQIYSQNNFYDMPKHTGPIWDNFVYANTLYLHTPKSLWRTYVNDVATQANSIGDVVMGTGALFGIPAKEVIVSGGGYAGSISQFGGVLTPMGYIFPDVLQGKIFMLQGEQLRCISDVGMKKYFEDNLAPDLLVGSNYVDNPYTGAGITGAYDFEKNRYLFVKTGVSNPITWSFSSLSEKWISEHDYYPNMFFSQNNQLIAFVNPTGVGTATVHFHNLGPYGTYYGALFPSQLSLVFNQEPGLEKVYDNMVIHNKSLDPNGVVDQLDTWDTVVVYTDTRNTGLYNIVADNSYGLTAVDSSILNIRAKRVKNKYTITIPGDSVVDESLDIFAPANLDPTRPFKPRIKGDHMTSDFVYNNSDNYKFIVNFMTCLYRHNAS